ncbi:MAG: hypothetical protein HC831_09895 [Chloroflexia bacterium]|nr:hypothetical protein [Chloroflexia bacterium]
MKYENIKLETRLEINQKNQQEQKNITNIVLDGHPDMKRWILESNSQSNTKISEEQIETFLSITKEIEKRIEQNVHQKSSDWLVKNKNQLLKIAKNNINNATNFWELGKRKSFIKQFTQHLDIASGLVKMNSGIPKGFELPDDLHSGNNETFIHTYREIVVKVKDEKDLLEGEKAILFRIFNDFINSYLK